MHHSASVCNLEEHVHLLPNHFTRARCPESCVARSERERNVEIVSLQASQLVRAGLGWRAIQRCIDERSRSRDTGGIHAFIGQRREQRGGASLQHRANLGMRHDVHRVPPHAIDDSFADLIAGRLQGGTPDESPAPFTSRTPGATEVPRSGPPDCRSRPHRAQHDPIALTPGHEHGDDQARSTAPSEQLS